MENKKNITVQQWLPFEKILKNGVIELKNKEYIKILKITPINYNLKSELEKEAILNSYKIFLKTCNFCFQILIQSNKEDLSKHIQKVNENLANEKLNTKVRITKNKMEIYFKGTKELEDLFEKLDIKIEDE